MSRRQVRHKRPALHFFVDKTEEFILWTRARFIVIVNGKRNSDMKKNIATIIIIIDGIIRSLQEGDLMAM